MEVPVLSQETSQHPLRELAPQKAEEQNNCLSLPQPPHSTVGQWVRLGQCAKSKTPRT